MTSKKQTLADYLQRKDTLRNANRYQGLSETERQRIEYFDAKKKKVGLLFNDILYQVKKSTANEENYTKIEKMIRAAAEQIKTEFDNTNKFTQEKPRGEITQFDTQADLWRISLHQNITGKETAPKVLKESNKISQGPVKQEADKTKLVQGNNRAKENSIVRDVKSRTYLPQAK